MASGPHGHSGCIQYYDLAYTSGLGFATVGANNGNNGTSGEPFYHNPDVNKDFAYGSNHTGVVVGKQLTKLFYEQGLNKPYHLGCSTGGRQRFESTQKYPHDFDGVVTGAPAFNFVERRRSGTARVIALQFEPPRNSVSSRAVPIRGTLGLRCVRFSLLLKHLHAYSTYKVRLRLEVPFVIMSARQVMHK
ncbi:tannase and feruloyl esterase-domain-containing protein [Aspergillus alliaceus]|uniref:tannase and feruloyl esterase-domain-containing protein n=1 Tax=Petromyces alliaceus TaxID=209559 RepID=UPI0012A4C860|nr:tannase and feruloyl esterase-domain-containing protein [Aspergillus alliaceus]KAB8229521.1 tannase and feruloyl esterase-domain-containing protein [Aspergillus alliaceus]